MMKHRQCVFSLYIFWKHLLCSAVALLMEATFIIVDTHFKGIN